MRTPPTDVRPSTPRLKGSSSGRKHFSNSDGMVRDKQNVADARPLDRESSTSVRDNGQFTPNLSRNSQPIVISSTRYSLAYWTFA